MNAIVISAIWGVLLMFCGAFVKSKSAPRYVAIAGLIILFIANGLELDMFGIGARYFSIDTREMLYVQSGNLAFIGVLILCTIFWALLSGRDVQRVGEHAGEYFALIFFVLCGASIVCTYNTLLMLFLGIEILSIPLYILTGSDKRNLKGVEAALKYFLTGSFSTGIMLMGIALIFGGNANASFYITNLQLGSGALSVMTASGIVFMLAALSFKVSAAPFHFWTPDVYDGAPAVFTSFMSTIVKAAGFFAFVRLFSFAFGSVKAQWQELIIFVTVFTLLIGNITAVFQQSVKRMLAYSSIAQAGFMMLAVFAVNDRAAEGLLLYAAAYSLATIGIFAVLIRMKDYTIDGFNGLGKTNRFAAVCLTIFLLSLTGIPLTAGFQSKFFMLMAAAEVSGKYWLILVALLFAAVSAYYYFRVIRAIWFKESEEENISEENKLNPSFNFMLGITAAFIIASGIWPEMLIGWIYH